MLNQDETPRLYSLVFGEGVVNDATSVVLFNAIQKLDLSHINSRAALLFTGNFLYLFLASTFLGVLVSSSLSCFMFYVHLSLRSLAHVSVPVWLEQLLIIAFINYFLTHKQIRHKPPLGQTFSFFLIMPRGSNCCFTLLSFCHPWEHCLLSICMCEACRKCSSIVKIKF